MTASKVLIELLQNPKEALGLSRHVRTILADWLEEAILSSSPSKAGEIHDALAEIFHSSLLRSSEDVRSVALSNKSVDDPLKQSYILGQLSLAQLLVAQALDRRASSEFTDALTDKTNANYIKALYGEPKTNKALSVIVEQTEENVSRKLKRLRELGIVYSKKMGTTVINSLTASAQSALEEIGLLKTIEDERQNKARVAVNDAFEHIKQSASEYMQTRPGFSRVGGAQW
ncbi:winged helix-turn-helix domain-containing protein [Pseudomonas sp. zjy_14]|uniref:helix-turn-helix domain-containing protein n=1 Tax=Pseudomonas sp. zjy_14 TaxID=3367264 RepID=UPI00370A76B2